MAVNGHCKQPGTTARPDSVQVYARSCLSEVDVPIAGEVTGAFPSWLRGRLLRNGPGLNAIGPDRYEHAFDGLALLREFSVEGNEVSFRNRFLRSQTYVRNKKANRIVVSEFGTAAYRDPCAGVFEKLAATFTSEFTDNALVNVTPIGEEFYAITESPFVHRIDPATLETLSRQDLSRVMAVHTITAHPHVDPDDGSTYLVGSQMGVRPLYVVVRFPPPAEVPPESKALYEAQIVATIPMQSRLYPSYIHSFGLTERWIVVVEQSLVFSVANAFLRRALGQDFAGGLQFDAAKKARFHVVDKKTGKTHPGVWEADAFFAFHHINTYERDGDIVVDMCVYEDASLIASMSLADARTDSVAYKSGAARRFVLDLNVGHPVVIRPQSLSGDELRADMPRINYGRFDGKPYRFVYLVGHLDGKPNETFLSKLDVESGNWVRWERPGWVPSEPVFVPRPEATDEDDGVVLTSLLDSADEKKVSLVALDARSFEEIASAEFETPSANPGDFHGWFASEG
ncbi:beta-carotene dioxygenase, putative [Ixodes scapularis]|uniref:Beta-carotene dioxygenase, putative n=1 Tax=Ixodes scapularis TaxID=6945 RepID=B7Q7A2_IXOSC|nr:beta-carotene dioxygenase, putative [Ixodes scapularis]|eukprot:XP_002412140.1 beta-carotene dioxygenase, putative [Ixodes scapularis]